MPQHYDPIQERIDTRQQIELETLRAECNRLAAERDALAKDNQRLLLSAKAVLDFNRTLLNEIKRLRSATACDDRDCCLGGPHIHYPAERSAA